MGHLCHVCWVIYAISLYILVKILYCYVTIYYVFFNIFNMHTLWWRHHMRTFLPLLPVLNGNPDVGQCLISITNDHWCGGFIVFWIMTLTRLLMKERGLSIFNSLRPRQNGRHFADDIFNYIPLIGNISIPIKISFNFVPRGPISNIPASFR